MSIRAAGQVERLLWAAAEARRLRAEPRKVLTPSAYAGTTLVLPAEQFTTEWQTVCLADRAHPVSGGRSRR